MQFFHASSSHYVPAKPERSDYFFLEKQEEKSRNCFLVSLFKNINNKNNV